MAQHPPVLSHLLTSALKNSSAPCFSGGAQAEFWSLSPTTITLNKVFLYYLTLGHFCFGTGNLVPDFSPTVKQVISFAQWHHACEQELPSNISGHGFKARVNT